MKNLNGKEIIELILDNLEIKAPTFATNIGVEYQRIFDIQREKTKKISGDLANKIIQAYPNINLSWLLTGDGDMLSVDDDIKDKPHYETTNFKPKPYVDSIYATLGVPNGFALAVKSDECERISLPFVNEYDFSIKGRGDSMINRDNPQRSICEGDIVACKIWTSRSHIRWGEVYCLATSDGVVIKKIMPAERENCIKCVSFNEEDGYRSYEIPIDEIHDWALVISVIHISNW